MIIMNHPVGCGADTGQVEMDCLKSTTKWLYRQVIKSSLPWLATNIKSRSYKDRRSRFFDRLIVLAERDHHA